MIRGAQQVERRAVRARRDDEHRLRLCLDRDQRAVFGDQHVAAAQDLAAREEDTDRSALRIDGVEAALLTRVPVELDIGGAAHEHRGEAGAGGDELAGDEHGC